MSGSSKGVSVVFTDLDEFLLDHDGYSFSGARRALHLLRERQIPVVFVTSKTRSEVEVLQADMGITDPFVVENEGGSSSSFRCNDGRAVTDGP